MLHTISNYPQHLKRDTYSITTEKSTNTYTQAVAPQYDLVPFVIQINKFSPWKASLSPTRERQKSWQCFRLSAWASLSGTGMRAYRVPELNVSTVLCKKWLTNSVPPNDTPKSLDTVSSGQKQTKWKPQIWPIVSTDSVALAISLDTWIYLKNFLWGVRK